MFLKNICCGMFESHWILFSLVTRWTQVCLKKIHWSLQFLRCVSCFTFCPFSLTCWCSVYMCQEFLTLWDPIDCSLLGSSIHGIFQVRILELPVFWFAISHSRRSSSPRDQTWVSCISFICRRVLYHCVICEALCMFLFSMHIKYISPNWSFTITCL